MHILDRSPIGLWSVVIDRSPLRSRKYLGFWSGHVADIAFHLAERVTNSTLIFVARNGPTGEVQYPEEATADEVIISLGHLMWESNEIKKKAFENFLNKEPCSYDRIAILNTNNYASVLLTKPRLVAWFDGGIDMKY